MLLKWKFDNNILFVNLCLLLFVFNPLITLGATAIITDMPVILSFAGMIYSMIYYNKGNKSHAIILLYIVCWGVTIIDLYVLKVSIFLYLKYKYTKIIRKNILNNIVIIIK